VEQTPFTEQYKFPVRDRRAIRTVCNPSLALLPQDQQQLHEDLSAVQGGDRFKQIETRIRDGAVNLYARELVTGHAGCGKSTELLRLANELRLSKNDRGERVDSGGSAFSVVYLDAYEYMNMSEVRLPQLIVSLLLALAKEPRFDLKNNRAAMSLWKQLGELFGSSAKELFKDFATGVPGLGALLRVDLPMQREFRKRAADHTQKLIQLANDSVLEAMRVLPHGAQQIVFVIDNLEKMPDGPAEAGRTLHQALFFDELPLLDLPAHLVFTYPISLNYGEVGLRQVFRNAKQTTIPMVGVRQKPEVAVRTDDVRGIAALRSLICRRVDASVFAQPAVLDDLIRRSGGCVRDLLRFVSDLPIVGEMPFSSNHVDQAIADYINDYERLLQGKPYLGLLHAIEHTGAFPENTADEWKRQLLMGLVVLEYDTGTWYDVHPLVKHTRAYRAAAPA
jgi:hypothetical protein